MPYKIPPHIPDIDEATASRLVAIAIRRRRALGLFRLVAFTGAVLCVIYII